MGESHSRSPSNRRSLPRTSEMSKDRHKDESNDQDEENDAFDNRAVEYGEDDKKAVIDQKADLSDGEIREDLDYGFNALNNKIDKERVLLQRTKEMSIEPI